jgi:hypothetical protein
MPYEFISITVSLHFKTRLLRPSCGCATATPLAGSFTRISDDPLFEWHGFATVPVPGKKGYSLVVSRAGDWTTKQIGSPPTHLWVRGVPTFGVLRIVPLFRRLVVVATGSGIGPCAPVIFEQKVPIKLLWTSPNVRETFGDNLVDAILEKSPDAIIYGKEFLKSSREILK